MYIIPQKNINVKKYLIYFEESGVTCYLRKKEKKVLDKKKKV